MEKSLLLKNILHNDKTVNILIVGNRFKSLDAPLETHADEVVDCSGLAILPAFFNSHTHSAMTLLRGYADDLPLYE
ncbi:MAG: amidohydrolase, partial [Bacteroidaceae bacterium]|nr:amidohydrolase [Bacteroidaceae bacterium]